MNVRAAAKRLHHRFVLCDVRKHTQFNLRIVSINQHASRLCHKHLPQLTAEFRANWNVL